MKTKDDILVCCDRCGRRDFVPRVYNDPVAALTLHTAFCGQCHKLDESSDKHFVGAYYVDKNGEEIWRYSV